MNSYVSFLGGMAFGAGRSSVPKERTVKEREREREREREGGGYKLCSGKQKLARATVKPYCGLSIQKIYLLAYPWLE